MTLYANRYIRTFPVVQWLDSVFYCRGYKLEPCLENWDPRSHALWLQKKKNKRKYYIILIQLVNTIAYLFVNISLDKKWISIKQVNII